jgi:hypothetical protein
MSSKKREITRANVGKHYYAWKILKRDKNPLCLGVGYCSVWGISTLSKRFVLIMNIGSSFIVSLALYKF